MENEGAAVHLVLHGKPDEDDPWQWVHQLRRPVEPLAEGRTRDRRLLRGGGGGALLLARPVLRVEQLGRVAVPRAIGEYVLLEAVDSERLLEQRVHARVAKLPQPRPRRLARVAAQQPTQSAVVTARVAARGRGRPRRLGQTSHERLAPDQLGVALLALLELHGAGEQRVEELVGATNRDRVGGHLLDQRCRALDVLAQPQQRGHELGAEPSAGADLLGERLQLTEDRLFQHRARRAIKSTNGR